MVRKACTTCQSWCRLCPNTSACAAPRQDDELAVRVGELAEEVEQILLARDPVMLAAHDQHRC
jgi:hypothetical protein